MTPDRCRDAVDLAATQDADIPDHTARVQALFHGVQLPASKHSERQQVIELKLLSPI